MMGDAGPARRICWLASYPKSGNTWTRILLGNLLREQDDARLVALGGAISSNRTMFDNLTGLSSADLTDDEIDLLRPDGYRMLAAEARDRLFIKVHDGWHANMRGDPLFPGDVSIGAIYLVRDPLDVAISYAYHQGHQDFARVVEQMNNPAHVMAGGKGRQLRQRTLGWSGHYRSWHAQQDIPVLTVRYEDMIADTARELGRMAEFLTIDADAAVIAAAVEASRFDRLRAAEERDGFSERPEKAARFFRSGRAGEGAERLDAPLQQRLRDCHGDLMLELGYGNSRADGG
ncbi:MAG: sulfotransferase domain-containing protein [Sphingopyxis sp.]|uniref:sulfotransferase domain-containing protein n=1 Tax=Sphingopyxis sp. TaxID=1908224 RepID=UPI003D80E83E